MTKDQYLQELEVVLKGLPQDERREILADYEEHFQMAYEDGKSDGEIIEALGSPKHLAKELAAGYYIEQAQNNISFPYIFRAVIAVLSLGFFNLVFVLGPFVGVLGFLAGLYIMDLTLLFTPTIAFFALLFEGVGVVAGFQAFFIAIGLTSLGVLMAVALFFLSKWLYQLLLQYLRFNLQIIQGKGDSK